jgi:hypothetical protein
MWVTMQVSFLKLHVDEETFQAFRLRISLYAPGSSQISLSDYVSSLPRSVMSASAQTEGFCAAEKLARYRPSRRADAA